MFSAYKIFNSQVRKHMLGNVSRYFFRWKKSLRPGASSIIDEQPWITFKAIDFLSRKLNKTHKVFEYGGGGSTLFFANRVAEVVTVEHNQEWFNTLNTIITEKKINHWKGNFIPPEKGNLFEPPDYANPEHYSSDDEPSKGSNYKSYVSAIDKFPDQYFDCVIIDGRSRPACIMHSINKIKHGGYLVLDNSDRQYYLAQTQELLGSAFIKIISEYGPSPYSQDFTHTSIWQRK